MGLLRVRAKSDGAGGSRIEGLRQDGSLKALFPRAVTHGPLEAVFLNTAGGLTGGDRMQIRAEVGPGAHLIVSSQAAERAYRAQPGPSARVDLTLTVEDGGRLDWLPQETIVFEGASVSRHLSLDLAAGGRALIVEPLILGRMAMGETVHDAQIRDRWEIWREGRLVFADALTLSGDLSAVMSLTGTGGGARAMAAMVYAGPDAASLLEPLRALLPPTAGASLVREGIVFARFLAEDGFYLRRDLIPAIERLTGCPVPKVWRL